MPKKAVVIATFGATADAFCARPAPGEAEFGALHALGRTQIV
ncbi:hypothetical protein [Actinacidiphila oryziradicis]|nr:hypothetical protein [Actinacidiphila oryziradicis]